jgi:hypothetical protein
MPEDEEKEWPNAIIRGFCKIDNGTVVIHADDRNILAGRGKQNLKVLDD